MERAFNPIGLTQVILATTTKSDPVQILTPQMDANQYRVFNSGSVPIFIATGDKSSDVTAKLTIPAAGSPQDTWPIAAGAVEVFSGPDDAWVSVMTMGGAGVVYITPGRGI